MNKYILPVFILFILFNCLKAQVVSTLTDQFNASGDIAIDSSGNIYVANFGLSLSSGGGKEVYKVTPEGEVSVFATGLNGASGNEFGPDGYLYQSNISAGIISKIASDGTVATFAAGLRAPVGITFDKDGNLYSANCGDNTIKKITPDGTQSTFSSSTLLSCPNGLTIDNDGNIYTCNFNNGNVIKITPDGTASLLTIISGGNNGHLTFKNNRLYVVSRGSHRIFEVGLDGKWKILAGTGARGKKDGPAKEATFSLPNGIGVSPDGNTIYVNDEIPLIGTIILTPVVLRKIDNILGNITSVNEEKTSDKLSLYQNYPNPFNPSTIIEYNVPLNAFIKLKIYDTMGREIETLVNEYQSAGNKSINFDAKNLSSGIYYYVLNYGSSRISKKMILLK